MMKRLIHEIGVAMNQRGATAIIVALSMIVLLGFIALAIDVSDLLMIRNELQNGADAGALAGARFLYNEDGTAVNTISNQIAYNAATANKALAMTGAIAVDVNWPAGTDVQRGHWSFGLGDLPRDFYPNEATTDPPDLWNKSTEELDADLNFINAIKVVARRQGTPAPSFFARIFGYDDFQLSADAVAYIGFAGTLEPWDVDQPIAICEESLRYDGDKFTCTVGRMIPSTEDTGGWTGFDQEEDGSCPPGGTNAGDVKDLVVTGCLGDGANDTMLDLNGGITYNEGQIDTAFQKFIECWKTKSEDPPVKPWKITLPVVDCSVNHLDDPNCKPLQGAVEINVIWIFREGPQYNDPLHPKNDEIIPSQMSATEGWEPPEEYAPTATTTIENGVWKNSSDDAEVRWNDFANYFNLQHTAGLITWEWLHGKNVQKTIFFLPDCEPHKPAGLSGGENFGILAEVPVLVK